MALQTTLHRYFVNKGARRRRRQTLITEYMIPRRKKRVCQYLMTVLQTVTIATQDQTTLISFLTRHASSVIHLQEY